MQSEKHGSFQSVHSLSNICKLIPSRTQGSSKRTGETTVVVFIFTHYSSAAPKYTNTPENTAEIHKHTMTRMDPHTPTPPHTPTGHSLF